jgi:hypothetical protein
MPPLPQQRYVRIDFECAFLVQVVGEGVNYRYVQRSDPKVSLVPDGLLISGQCNILLKVEVVLYLCVNVDCSFCFQRRWRGCVVQAKNSGST